MKMFLKKHFTNIFTTLETKGDICKSPINQVLALPHSFRITTEQVITRNAREVNLILRFFYQLQE